MRIRSAVGDDDRVTTTFAQCEPVLIIAGTAQQRPPAHYWTSCAVYPFAFTPMPHIVKVYARQALNRELVFEFRYEIQPNRTPDFSGFAFPGMGAEGTDNVEKADR